MIGHRQILALREQGMKPAAIFLADRDPPKSKYVGRDIECGGLPSVYVGGDNPQLADVRFAFGCEVHLHADDESRAVAWLDALLAVKPKRVIQCTGGEVYEWRT